VRTAKKAMNQKSEKIKVWPEMVLWETLSAIIATIILVLVSMYIDAPLESIADPSTSTNPSKAPWYFLGLQELLVYYSPWVAGVLIPTCILLSLAAFPYIDVKGATTSGKAQYGLEKKIKAVFTGGLVLWIMLTIIGVYLRGPNWRLQWPNGNPIGTNAAVMPVDWLVPAIITGYILFVFLRLNKFRENIKSVGLLRCLLPHAMILSGLIVIIKISLFTMLSF
jgi:hypothetical protein